MLYLHEGLVNGSGHQVGSIILNEVAAIWGDYEPAPGTAFGEFGLQAHPDLHLLGCRPMWR